MVSLGVFRDSIMNDAVYKFRRYEDASLSYTGIEKHFYDASVGLFDTALSKADYEQMKLQDSRLTPEGLSRAGSDDIVVEATTIDERNASMPRRRQHVEVLPDPSTSGTPEEKINPHNTSPVDVRERLRKRRAERARRREAEKSSLPHPGK